MNDSKKNNSIEMQNEEQELIERLRYWQTVSIEKRLEWLENSIRFVQETKQKPPTL